MGLARVVTPEGTDAEPGLTQAGVFLGTPDYVSPEQAEELQHVNTLGASSGGRLDFLLTAEVPFPGRTLVEKGCARRSAGPPSVLAKRKDVPPSLDGVVRKVLLTLPTATRRRADVVPVLPHPAWRKGARPTRAVPRVSCARRRWAKSRCMMAAIRGLAHRGNHGRSRHGGKIAGLCPGRR